MKQYHTLIKDILANGEVKGDRTGTGTISVFARQLRFNLAESFPAITTKKLAFKACKGELIWFLEGSGDERRLAEITHGALAPAVPTIWTPNAMAPYWEPKAKFEGDLGRVYGVQWRHWQKTTTTGEEVHHDDFGNSYRSRSGTKVQEIDQVKQLIQGLKKDPNGRRHILSAWNVGELDQMALPPCHVMSQYYVNNGKLSCHMYQRSVDVFLGLPFNIASYALLTHMIAQVCDLFVGELIISTGDTHIYLDHVEQVKEQLTREPFEPPQLWLNTEIKDIDRFTMDDIWLNNYQSHGAIKAKMAV